MTRSADLGQFRRVGDDDDGMAVIVHLSQRRHHFLAALAVERAGRLVGENDLATVHQRAGNRYTLLLAAGQLVGQMIEPVAKPQRAQQHAGAFFRSRDGMPA